MQTDEFIAEAHATAACFRQENGAEGNKRLVALIDALSTLLMDVPAATVSQVNQLLAIMLAALERREYQQLANMLEQELPQLLDSPFTSNSVPGSVQLDIDALLKNNTSTLSREEIVLNSLIAPRLPVMREQYRSNLALLRQSGYQGEPPEFDDLPFWLIDNGLGDQFILYHKQKGLIGIEISQAPATELPVLITASVEFADYLIADQWNWSQLVPLFAAIRQKGKIAYLIPGDPGRFFSCLQGVQIAPEQLEDVTLFDGVDSLKSFFKETDAYLPRNIIAHSDNCNLWQEAVNELHQYRITPEGRKGSNVLLSIGIPSYNHGHQALAGVLHHLTSQYDEEIEIVLSNNGTSIEQVDDDEQIGQLDDARLVCCHFAEHLEKAENFCKMSELAKGRFLLLLSGEDILNLQHLPQTLELLRQNDDLAILRVPTRVGDRPPALSKVPAGDQSLVTFMLSANDLSGNIFNNRLLAEKNVTAFFAEHGSDNAACAVYPHMVWELLIARHGAVLGANISLITEGTTEKNDKSLIQVGTEETVKLPANATVEARLAQHQGFLQVFLNMGLCQDNLELLRTMYHKLCLKTLFLVQLSIRTYYAQSDVDQQALFDLAYQCCLDGLDELYQTLYPENPAGHTACYADNAEADRARIIKYFDQFKL